MYLSMILGANFESESGPEIPLNTSLILKFGGHLTRKKGTSLLVSQIDSMDRARQHIRLMTHRFDFPCHFSDTSPRENVTEMVNWVKIRTKVSVDSLGVRIFTPIFRG